MNKLISKIQYTDFEPGEFVEEKERRYDETINIIEQIPWEKEELRSFADMTTTSVTIESKAEEYLKLALYFEGKFVLYFFNHKKELYSKSFYKIQDAYPFIRQFYQGIPLNINDFISEVTFLREIPDHFRSKSFEYKIDKKRIRSFLLQECGIQFLFSLLLIIFCLSNPVNMKPMVIIFLLLVCFLGGGGMNIVLFLNYYNCCKNFILIMSMGNDVFYYGDKDNPIQFHKKDIDKVISYETPSYGGWVSVFAGFEVVKIIFKTGRIIEIPSLCLNSYLVTMKIKDVISQTKYVFYPSMTKAIYN